MAYSCHWQQQATAVVDASRTMSQYGLEDGTSGPSGLSPLPQEMWDAILLNLRDDKRTLSACCLTCRSWTYTARQLLWRTVWLKSVGALCILLHQCPQVASMIHTLRVDVYRESNLATLEILLKQENEGGALEMNIYQGLSVPSVTSLTMIGYWSRATLLRIVGCFPHLQELCVDCPATVNSRGLLDVGALDLSHNTRLTRLQVSMFTDLHSIDVGCWGDHIASPLAKIGRAHTALTDVSLQWTTDMLSTLCYLVCDPRFTVYPHPGRILARELSRILDELPRVKFVFSQEDELSRRRAMQAQQDIAKQLLQASPGLLAHSERVKWQWSFTRNEEKWNPSAPRAGYASELIRILDEQCQHARGNGSTEPVGPAELFDFNTVIGMTLQT
ncbi:hypothetical protein FOMPIDRAFT_1018233 [Fomitopsis schrenkii]|uniref:F-box domain-containing protein n=1 Tax=Fomitopsis schrenkii TaxID=2126942 RepID=S8DWJ5_FOMSC|nr:hypothetical protein FOMPIDRAFT_1018233 [Fomitopsis schrenkii]